MNYHKLPTNKKPFNTAAYAEKTWWSVGSRSIISIVTDLYSALYSQRPKHKLWNFKCTTNLVCITMNENY